MRYALVGLASFVLAAPGFAAPVPIIESNNAALERREPKADPIYGICQIGVDSPCNGDPWKEKSIPFEQRRVEKGKKVKETKEKEIKGKETKSKETKSKETKGKETKEKHSKGTKEKGKETKEKGGKSVCSISNTSSCTAAELALLKQNAKEEVGTFVPPGITDTTKRDLTTPVGEERVCQIGIPSSCTEEENKQIQREAAKFQKETGKSIEKGFGISLGTSGATKRDAALTGPNTGTSELPPIDPSHARGFRGSSGGSEKIGKRDAEAEAEAARYGLCEMGLLSACKGGSNRRLGPVNKEDQLIKEALATLPKGPTGDRFKVVEKKRDAEALVIDDSTLNKYLGAANDGLGVGIEVEGDTAENQKRDAQSQSDGTSAREQAEGQAMIDYLNSLDHILLKVSGLNQDV